MKKPSKRMFVATKVSINGNIGKSSLVLNAEQKVIPMPEFGIVIDNSTIVIPYTSAYNSFGVKGVSGSIRVLSIELK